MQPDTYSIDTTDRRSLDEPLPPKEKGKYDPEKLRGVFWVTGKMAANYDREYYLVTTAKETVIYIIFLIIVTIGALGMMNPTMFFMTQGVRTQLKDIKFKSGDVDITFDEVRRVSEFWDYMEKHFAKQMYKDNFYAAGETTGPQDKGIVNENKLIGAPVIRHIGVKSVDAEFPFGKFFNKIWPKYTDEFLLKDTHGGLTFQSPTDTKAVTFTGKLAHYPASGHKKKLATKSADAVAEVTNLKKAKFVAQGTRAIFVDFTLYNPNVNLFCSVKLLFEFSATGIVQPTAYFHTLKLLRYSTKMDYFVFACECVYALFIVFHLCEALRELVFLKWAYFGMFWSYIDMAILVSSLTYLIGRMLQYMALKDMFADLVVAETFDHTFQEATKNELSVRNMQAVALFMVYMKVFQFLSFNKTMTTLSRTLNKCAADIAWFCVMFAIVFVAFAEFGLIVFGPYVPDFAYFGICLFTLLRTLLGDFEYPALEKADHVMAPLFFLLFIFLVFFILLNMFLAIINDTYGDVKTEMNIGPEEMQMSEFWKRGFYNLMTECGCGRCAPTGLLAKSDQNPTAEEIRAALKRVGFSDLDVDMFLSRYNIDPEAQVRVKDVSKLIENMRSEDGKKAQGGKGVEPTQEKQTTPAQQQPIVAMDDFAAQQDRLDRVESTMAGIAEKLELLLKKLNTLDKWNKPV